MPDREKVIKGLECCLTDGRASCEKCYQEGPWFGIACRQGLMRDALELLKEQKPVEPRLLAAEEVQHLQDKMVICVEQLLSRKDEERGYTMGKIICTKEAREACDLAYMCEENAEVMDDSECANLIVKKEAVKWDDVIECLNAQPTVSGWISVKDRLPEHGKRYLIYAISEDNKIGHITTAAFGGHFALSGRCAHWKVTHWMPLPTPPEVNSCDD